MRVLQHRPGSARPMLPIFSLQGDFGLTMSMRQESAISPVGTVEYMAPEVTSDRWLVAGRGGRAATQADKAAAARALPGWLLGFLADCPSLLRRVRVLPNFRQLRARVCRWWRCPPWTWW